MSCNLGISCLLLCRTNLLGHVSDRTIGNQPNPCAFTEIFAEHNIFMLRVPRGRLCLIFLVIRHNKCSVNVGMYMFAHVPMLFGTPTLTGSFSIW